MKTDRPSTTLDHWRDLKARTWEPLIWWLMTRVLSPLLRLVLRLFDLFQPSPSMPEHFNARSSARPMTDGTPLYIEFNGQRLTHGTIDLGSKPPSDLWGEKPEAGEDAPKWSDDSMDFVRRMLLDANPVEYSHPAAQHYRDEDGELRPARFDRSTLSDASLEDLAAEFLRAQSDAEAAPDPLEREIIAALRDAYGLEIWRRCTSGGFRLVRVGGCRYEIVPDGGGTIRIIPLDGED